jgi:hypothetical protein
VRPTRYGSYRNSRFSKRGCDIGCNGPEPVPALPQLKVQQPCADAAGTAALDPDRKPAFCCPLPFALAVRAHGLMTTRDSD